MSDQESALSITSMIQRFETFIQAGRLGEILENSRHGKHLYNLNFFDLAQFDVELSERFLDTPDETVAAFRIAVNSFDLPNKAADHEFQVSVLGLPDSQRRLIASKRTKDLGRLIFFEGIVRAKGHVLSRTVSITFECPSCGNLIRVDQVGQKKVEPTRCGCGRKGKFRVVPNGKLKTDVQRLELEELPENVKGTSQPQRLKVELRGCLVDPKFEGRFNPGARVRITGVLQELPITLRNGSESVDSDFLFEASHIEAVDEEEFDYELSKDELAKIQEIATSKDCIDTLVKSIVPSIFGHDKIKEAILVQLVGGVRKIKDDGTIFRGDIHILMIGDPGSGKSTILKRLETVVPHARVANGKGASGVGLTAAVIRDEFMGWTFQAGTLVLAHKSIAIIDEFDKMSKEDRDQIHEALEQQTVTIAKAQVQARLACECSLIAGANPKYGRFEAYGKVLAEQIDLPPTIINRFELIFPVMDIPEESTDGAIVDKIFESQMPCVDGSCKKIVETSLLRKYLVNAKKLKPTFTKEATAHIKDYYLKLRARSGTTLFSRSVPISPRQLEGLIRLSEAYAKLRRSDKVLVCDAKKAISLMEYCFRSVAFDSENGVIDLDMIGSEFSSSKRSAISLVGDAMDTLLPEHGKAVPIDQIIIWCKEKGLSEEKVADAIIMMRKKGDLFEPRHGYVAKI